MLDGLFFGPATQREAARRRRPRGAVREQEDEDAQGHGAGQRVLLPRRSSGRFVRLKQSKLRSCAGLRRLVPGKTGDRARRGRGGGDMPAWQPRRP